MQRPNKYVGVLLMTALTVGPTLLGDTIKVEDSYCYKESTKLMKAIYNNFSPDDIYQLIVDGEDVNAVDSEYIRYFKPVLRYALDRGTDTETVEIIKMLINAGADVNQKTYNRVTNKKIYGMMPLLTYATLYSSAEIVQILIDAGAQDRIESKSSISFKKTALAIAQELGKPDIISILERGRLKR